MRTSAANDGIRLRLRQASGLLAITLLVFEGSAVRAATSSEALPATVSAAVTNTVGKATKVVAAVETASFTCNSSTYQDITGMQVTFKMGKPGPIVVIFQGEWLNADNAVRLRALDNDVVFPGPGDTGEEVIVYDGSDVSTHGFNFIEQATAGSHTIKVQCRLPNNGDVATLDEQSMIVLHR